MGEPRNTVETEAIELWKKWDGLFALDSEAQWIDEQIEKDGHAILKFIQNPEISIELRTRIEKEVLAKDR